MRNLFRALFVTCVFAIYTAAPVCALTDQDIIDSLEIAEAWDAAYPLARQLAAQANTYQGWRNLAAKYVAFDTDGEAYMRAWQLAKQANKAEIYRDFIAIHPGTVMNVHAIRALYNLARASGKIKNLLDFIREFPDRVESIEAMLAVQELAFAQAKQKDDPVVYDTFVTTFSQAPQVPEAMQLALAAEQRILKAHNANLDRAAHDALARTILNDGRIAEKNANQGKGDAEAAEHPEHIVPILSARKYRLLENMPEFRDTEVVTELLDRHERVAYHRLELAQLQGITNQVKSMQDAVVGVLKVQIAATTAQSERLAAEIRQQTGLIKAVGERLVTEMNKQTATLGAAIGRVETVVNRVDASVNRVETAVNQVNSSVNDVKTAVGNMEELLVVHNQRMSQQLNVLENSGSGMGAIGIACESTGSVLGAIAGALAGGYVGNLAGSLASPYLGKAVGGLAGELAGTTADAAVGSYVGHSPAQWVKFAVGGITQIVGTVAAPAAGAFAGGHVGGKTGGYVGGSIGSYVCDSVGNLANAAKEQITALTEPFVNQVNKIWNNIGDLFGATNFQLPTSQYSA